MYTYTFSSKTHRNLFILPCLHFLNYPSTSNYSMKARTFPPFVHAHRAAEIGSQIYLAHNHPRTPARAYLSVVQVHQCLGHLPYPSTSRTGLPVITSFSMSFSSLLLLNFPANCDNDLQKHVRIRAQYTGKSLKFCRAVFRVVTFPDRRVWRRVTFVLSVVQNKEKYRRVQRRFSFPAV